jgi:hypothetical protein
MRTRCWSRSWQRWEIGCIMLNLLTRSERMMSIFWETKSKFFWNLKMGTFCLAYTHVVIFFKHIELYIYMYVNKLCGKSFEAVSFQEHINIGLMSMKSWVAFIPESTPTSFIDTFILATSFKCWPILFIVGVYFGVGERIAGNDFGKNNWMF